jgi:hypothetical protein
VVDKPKTPSAPVIWALNPYRLNSWTWKKGVRDIILPRYLGLQDDEEFWDFGELLLGTGDWAWDEAVAIYPAQINDRVRAQRGWFTIHGNDRRPLELQAPGDLIKLVLKPECVKQAIRFLELFGFHRFAVYPDLDNLALWVRQSNLAWADARRARKARRKGKRARRKA